METATKSTSTLHYVTSSDVATQTAGDDGDGEASHTDTSDSDNDSSDEEMEEAFSADIEDETTRRTETLVTSEGEDTHDDADERTQRKSLMTTEGEDTHDDADERTQRKTLMTSEGEDTHDDADERTQRKRLMLSPDENRNYVEDQERSREGLRRESEVDIPAAVNNVQIIQEQHVTNEYRLTGSVCFDWSNFIEQIIAEKITAAQRTTEAQLKSVERTLKKEVRKCNDVMKKFTKQLLKNQNKDAAEKQRLIREIQSQREEMDRKQRQMTEIQHQTLDQVTKLAADQEEARRKEKEGRSFVFKLGEKHKRVLERVWTRLEQSKLVQLMKRLYQKFKIKLKKVSMDSDMEFVVTVPPENVEQQAAIQEVIQAEIVPEDLQTVVEWETPVPCFGEVELNPPVQVTEGQEDGSAGGASADDQCLIPTTPEPLLTFDPMTAVPERSFEVRTSETEESQCCVTSLLITGSGLLVMADCSNRKVMCTPLERAHAGPALSTRHLRVCPWDLALYREDVIAVATDTNVIFLLTVASDVISTSGQVETERAYRSVTSHGDGDLLVAGSVRDSEGPAVVDVITREGQVLWTLVDDRSFPDLEFPSCLHLCNRQVLVADIDGPVYRVDATSGLTYPVLSDPALKKPWQVTADAAGSAVWVTGMEMDHVLVLSLTTGQCRPLLTAREHAEGEFIQPRAVGVTQDGVMVVSWAHPQSDKTVVIAYNLSQS